jgi:uncharacterized protein (TIGR02145 family)
VSHIPLSIIIISSIVLISGCADGDNPAQSSNTKPSALFTVTPAENGTTGIPFYFDASGCSDAEDKDADLLICWDWENDGVFDTPLSNSRTALHYFDEDGIYTVKLMVRDSGGLFSTATRQVQVTGAAEGEVTDIDGHTYKTIKIGTRWWMAENLRVMHYRNGDAIPYVTDSQAWTGLPSGAFCSYDNNTSYVSTYGQLYNWYAAADSRGLAPEGWKIPGEVEWQMLVDHLGGESVAGGKLKGEGASQWNSPNAGATNESGFSAWPGGYRLDDSGTYSSMGEYACFWSSTSWEQNGYFARYLFLHYNYSAAYFGGANKHVGYAVRCIRE